MTAGTQTDPDFAFAGLDTPEVPATEAIQPLAAGPDPLGALAGLLGRDYVIPDDIKALAEPALAHRLIIKTSSSIHDVQSGNVIRELLDSIAIEGIRPTGGPNGPRSVTPAPAPAEQGAASA